MDEKPKIAQNGPYIVKLEGGKKYWFCTCGLSSKQPFCDGSHKGACTLKPLSYTAEKTQEAALCGCKHTKTPPFCDGSHGNL